MQKFKKSKNLWNFIFIFWIFFIILISYFLYKNIILNQDNKLFPLIIVLLIFFMFGILFFWFSGIKDFIYVHVFMFNRKKIYNKIKQIDDLELGDFSNAKILLLYCTYNDFNANALFKSMQQDYKNFETIILDDSSDIKYIQKINKFAKTKNIKVVRRQEKKGFKAGNLNNFLKNNNDYDYFVVLDSDEIIPNDFIVKSLKYFKFYNNVGIVQAGHISTRNRNSFMKKFYYGVNSHWETFQNIKSLYGFSFFLGHGAMISKKSYQLTNGFPEIVAEDLAFSLEVRRHNLMTIFAPNIICEEEFPISYQAFKTRQIKWTFGSLEFLRKYFFSFFRNKYNLSKSEKYDLLLSSTTILFTFLSLFFFNIYFIVIPFIGGHIYMPWWTILITTLFFLSPMLNDLYHYLWNMSFLKLINYLFHSFLLYGSVFVISIQSIFLSFCGKKARFIVTQKNALKFSVKFALLLNWKELVLFITLCTLILFWPWLLFVFWSLLIVNLSTIYLTILSNFNLSEDKTSQYIKNYKFN